jgi:N,N-dimethylformamidase
MKQSSRRAFIKQSSAAALAAATPRGSAAPPQAEPVTEASAGIPPHRALHLPGIHAYPDSQSVAAGEAIRFHVSGTEPYQLSIYRLGPTIDDPAGNELMQAFETSAASPQPIHPGSYVHVENGLRDPLGALTLECWVRPWRLARPQGLISQGDKDDPRALALTAGPGGCIGFYIGNGVSPGQSVMHQTKPGVLAENNWHHVLALWDGAVKEVWVNGKRIDGWPFAGGWVPGPHPLRLGAVSDRGLANHFLDGDLAGPVIYQRSLAPEEIARRFEAKGTPDDSGAGVLACWPFSEERGDHVADKSGGERHGRIINHATWMIGGPAFDGAKVPRYGDYDPAADASRGHGLRFASDDLYDCRWRATHEWLAPATARSGLYIARIRQDPAGKPGDYFVTFIVRKARSRSKAPMLVLCSSSTWLAYNSAPFSQTIPRGANFGTEGYRNSHPEAPAWSCYVNHHAGQPGYQFGLRMPWPSAGPYLLYSAPATGYSHLMRAERFLHVWLDQAGYEYDVVSDLDLHRDPGLLKGYRTLVINGHSEYWSKEAYEGVDRFLSEGGTAVVLSGNTMFWRTSFNADGTVMECRKHGESIGGRSGARIGELYHSHDGRRGSLMRECGYPAWKNIGLECVGWGGTTPNEMGIYQTDAPDHFLFNEPEKTGLTKDAAFGHAPGGGVPRAIGHEWDVRLGRLKLMTASIPPGASLPDEPSGIVTLARGIRKGGGGTLDYFTAPAKAIDDVCAEMIYWERPNGGRVFHAGAIGAGWAISADPKLQALMRNVLHHFGVKPTPR